MNPIVQNHHDLPPAIQREGCLFRSLSMLAEIKAAKTLTVSQDYSNEATEVQAECELRHTQEVVTSYEAMIAQAE